MPPLADLSPNLGLPLPRPPITAPEGAAGGEPRGEEAHSVVGVGGLLVRFRLKMFNVHLFFLREGGIGGGLLGDAALNLE